MKEFDFEKTPIVEIANEILLDGVKRGASDIHFDPYKDGLAIRMRVDGVLYDYSSVPPEYKRNMISRIKMIASMNIMETRLPQDGAIKSKIGDKTLDLRVSSLPTHNGEKVVLRILDYSKSLQGLETLGFSEHNLKKIIEMIEIPNGIVLVTGATGSGKSTTVYSILQKLNTREVNIITVEDPVEMEVEGLNQVQAQHEIGLDFATVLRSILRQDPDIIMIGEIRDGETARIAVRASITGHKVLSTIHTNNALNTIERLTDMEVERYLIGTSLNGIISQKLARKLCPHCRIARETNDYEKSLFRTVLHKNVDKVYDVNPDGCEHCFKGYRDRIAIAEVLVITDAIRSAITTAQPKEVMRKLVYYDGHTHTLLEDGLEKIELGETNFEEIFKLVDLENDLAVAKSFYDEIEEALKKNPNATKDTIETNMTAKLKEEESDEDKYKKQNNNIIEIDDGQPEAKTEEVTEEVQPKEETKTKPKAITEDTLLTEDNVDALESFETTALDTEKQEETTVEETTEPQPEVIESLDKQETPEALESLDEDKNDTVETLDVEPEKIETVETLDTKPEIIETLNEDKDNTVEALDLDKPEEIETLDETPEVLETLDETKPQTVEEVDLDDNKDDKLEVLDEKPLESLDTEPALTNPLKDGDFGIETLDDVKPFDGPLNYDQMVSIPFVDETVDL